MTDLKPTLTRTLPPGVIDDSTYSQIEDELDKLEAPMRAADGRFLALVERLAAYRQGDWRRAWKTIDSAPLGRRIWVWRDDVWLTDDVYQKEPGLWFLWDTKRQLASIPSHWAPYGAPHPLPPKKADRETVLQQYNPDIHRGYRRLVIDLYDEVAAFIKLECKKDVAFVKDPKGVWFDFYFSSRSDYDLVLDKFCTPRVDRG